MILLLCGEILILRVWIERTAWINKIKLDFYTFISFLWKIGPAGCKTKKNSGLTRLVTLTLKVNFKGHLKWSHTWPLRFDLDTQSPSNHHWFPSRNTDTSPNQMLVTVYICSRQLRLLCHTTYVVLIWVLRMNSQQGQSWSLRCTLH